MCRSVLLPHHVSPSLQPPDSPCFDDTLAQLARQWYLSGSYNSRIMRTHCGCCAGGAASVRVRSTHTFVGGFVHVAIVPPELASHAAAAHLGHAQTTHGSHVSVHHAHTNTAGAKKSATTPHMLWCLPTVTHSGDVLGLPKPPCRSRFTRPRLPHRSAHAPRGSRASGPDGQVHVGDGAAGLPQGLRSLQAGA